MIEAMPRPKLPHLQHERTRHGSIVWYVRRGKGPRIRLRGTYGTDEFMAEYRAAIEGNPLPAPRKASVGTLAWLIARYRESSAWASLASTTRRQRELIYKSIIESAGTVPYAAITAKDIRQGRERRKTTPFAANNWLKAMRGLFAWAVDAEYISSNPAADVAFLPVKTEGHAPWSLEDVRAYESRWPIGTRERVWLHVLLYTGFRLGDACIVGRQHAKDGWIRLRAEKTGVTLEIPIFKPLQETLDAGGTGDMAWICNAWGKPFIKEAFGNAFRRACKEAGLTGKSAHGLRKLLAAHAAESDVSEEQMQSFFGWKSNRMSAIYTRSANRKRMAEHAADKMARTIIQGAGRDENSKAKTGT